MQSERKAAVVQTQGSSAGDKHRKDRTRSERARRASERKRTTSASQRKRERNLRSRAYSEPAKRGARRANEHTHRANARRSRRAQRRATRGQSKCDRNFSKESAELQATTSADAEQAHERAQSTESEKTKLRARVKSARAHAVTGRKAMQGERTD